MQKSPEKQTAWSIIFAVSIIVVAFLVTYATTLYFAEADAPASVDPEKIASGNAYLTASGSDADGRYVFLAAGEDAISGLTDVIMLVSMDTVSGKVCVLQLPRDTFLRYTNRSYKKLNGASHALGGLRGLADIIEQSLGIHVDYTLEFTLETFSQLVDLIGGVPMNIPCDMDYDDPSQGLYIHLAAGEHLLCGAEAVQFVRFRSGYIRGDIGRADAQKLFLAALARKVTTGVSVLRLPAIIGAVIGQVETDMSFSECLNLARAAMKLETSDIVMLTLPGRDARTGGDSGAWYYIMNRKATADVLVRHFELSPDFALDAARLFSDSAYPHFDEIYDAAYITAREYSADDINQNGIGIDRTTQ